MPKTKLVILALLFLYSCTKTHEDKIEAIKQKYSPEVINHFYELCFNRKNNDTISLKKWDQDILFYTEGDTIQKDKPSLLKFVSTINALNLPFKITEVKNKQKANLIIRSGPEKELGLERPNRGETITHFNRYNYNDSASIAVSNEVERSKRVKIYYHEFFHAFGFQSHCTTNARSIQYALSNERKELTEKDKKTLQMLYEPIWPDQYTSVDFESDFADELYHVNGKEKFQEFAKTNEVDSLVLATIYKYCLTKPDSTEELQILKHANNIPLSYKGILPTGLFDTLNVITKAINSATPNFSINLIKDSKHFLNGILLDFIPVDTVNQDYLGVISGTGLADKNDIKTVFTSHLEILYHPKYSKFKQTLASILYSRVITGNKYYNLKPCDISGDTMQLRPFFNKLLDIYYAPELPHNFKKSELKEVVEELE